jgi:hypothetical protein
MLDGVKRALLEQGAKLAQSPAVMKLLQNERIMKGLMQALMLRGKVEGLVDQQVEKLAKSLQLATREEVRELQRALRRIQEELDRKDGGNGAEGG